MKILEVKDVSIRYLTGDFKELGLKGYIFNRLRGKYDVKEFWADRHITFSLEQGDMLGIVGTNGAGKSTLLKSISGTLPPTEGKVIVRGRVAALLELSSGFDGDLTVKENTYLRGALLGYSRQFMNEKYDEIIKFAELEEFQDRRFSQLSSGMKSRLAFSIACLVDPEILILDEVLSVGDAAFRAKSEERMKEILGNGVTGILVSHSVAQARSMCNKALWLDHGKQVAFGPAQDILNAYAHFVAQPKEQRVIPESMEEIQEISKKYQLYKALAAEERAQMKLELKRRNKKNHTHEKLPKEKESLRERRWMEIINAMSEEERQQKWDEYVAPELEIGEVPTELGAE